MSSEIECTIDGKKTRVAQGTTVYEAAKQLGIELPIFCYHDRMPPFGACRVCLVEVEKMGKLQTSCTLEAKEGMLVHTRSEKAVLGREGILEFLLINHPLDCPICDKGGECPLQDQALEYGPGKSRFFEEKRHFPKPLPLTPVLMLDRERCIICARCTRFSEEISGDHALQLIERGYKSEVGVADGKIDFKFLGNTIAICPVGALTSQTYRFQSRPWDNSAVNSTCTLCPMGCQQTVDARNQEIVRVRAREYREINDVWMCDKGLFGYEYTSHPERLKTPLLRIKGELEQVSWDEALSFFADRLVEAIPKKRIAAFGGVPLTCEENYLFQDLVRNHFGVPHIDHRIGTPLFSLQEEGFYGDFDTSFQEFENVEVILLFGTDVTEELPVLWLRLKKAIAKGAKVLFIGHFSPEIARYIDEIYLHPPLEEISLLQKLEEKILSMTEGKNSAVFIGNQYLSSLNRLEVLFQIQSLQEKAPTLHVHYIEGKGNSHGARFAGVHPELGPDGSFAKERGMDPLEVLKDAGSFGWDLLYVVGANPVQSLPLALWQPARKRLGTLIVQDLFITETAREADLVLPALSSFEKKGTFINVEKQCLELFAADTKIDGPLSDGDIFIQLAQKMDKKLSIPTHFLSQLKEKRIHSSRKRIEKPSPRPHLSAGSLRITLAPSLFDEGVKMVHNPHLRALIRAPVIRLHPKEARLRNISSNEIVSIHLNGMHIAATLLLDEKVAERTVVIPRGFRSLPIHQLGSNLLNGIEVNLEKRSP